MVQMNYLVVAGIEHCRSGGHLVHFVRLSVEGPGHPVAVEDAAKFTITELDWMTVDAKSANSIEGLLTGMLT